MLFFLPSFYRKVRGFILRVPYAAILLLPAIYQYYSISSYQPYKVFLYRFWIYSLINIIIYGLARLITGTAERATVATGFLLASGIVSIELEVQWIRDIAKLHPEILLIPLLFVFFLRFIRINHKISSFIHLSVLIWMIILHLNVGFRWIRDRYYYKISPPPSCPRPSIHDTAFVYPDIYCLVFDAFGHPDTLERYLGLNFSYPKTLLKDGFMLTSLSLSHHSTLLILYGFFSPEQHIPSIETFYNHFSEAKLLRILSYAPLPYCLRDRGYELKGYLPMYYALQYMPCFDFHGYYNIFDLTLPYARRFAYYFWNHLALLDKPFISKSNNPTFYYYHLLTSHYPYTFNVDGSYLRSKQDDLPALRASFAYTENILLELVRDIHTSRKDNPRPYAILIFSDHGPHHDWRNSAFNIPADTVYRLMHSAFAALYTSWELPDSTRQAFLRATHPQHLGQVVLHIANPVHKQTFASSRPYCSP